MNKIRELRSDMAVNIIGAIVALLVILGVIVSTLGYFSFTRAFQNEYSTTTYHMADTATTLVNGDHLEAYLAGEEKEEYEQTKEYLDAYCHRMHVSLVYVILVDQSDYGRFVSIFNSVDNSVDNSEYTPWELGLKRDTTNDEYRQNYEDIYHQRISFGTVYRTNPPDGQHPHITTLVPIKNSAGEVSGILCIQRPMSELYAARRPYLFNIGVFTVLMSILAGIFAAWYIRKHFVEPISKVSDEATRFASENTKGEPLGEISKLSEISDLAASIDTMETDMVNYIDNLTAATAEKERIGAELSLASTIQESSIPNTFPAFPERDDFDIYATMIPAKEVGGDFYNFFLIDDDHLALMIGDVSGKGVPGALFMMVTNILLSDRAQMGGAPGEILTAVNNNICRHNQSEMFITLWLGILEISTGKIIAANAGHDDAAVYRKDGSFELFKTKHGIVVGAMEDTLYKDFEIQLGKGDKLFLYTDGAPEATRSDNQMYGMERLVQALNDHRQDTPKQILEGVHQSINEFVGEAPQFDDLTMLCLELKEKE
ncbi:MAG: SpoIIE family protein phosphatase [Solobacterium sp.]|nr:SpoIIE family protein phosphatase [Solobacterium sp.]